MTIASAVEQGQTWTISADIEPRYKFIVTCNNGKTSKTCSYTLFPSFIALGPYHLALGMNNRAWFYALSEVTVELLRDREYLGTVTQIHLNGDYCSVGFDGRVQLHVLEGEGHDGEVSEERESRIFPEQGRNDVISCHALTPDFLVLGTDMGGISYFFLEDWATVQEFRHMTGVKELVPEPNGTKTVVVDAKGQVC